MGGEPSRNEARDRCCSVTVEWNSVWELAECRAVRRFTTSIESEGLSIFAKVVDSEEVATKVRVARLCHGQYCTRRYRCIDGATTFTQYR